MIWQLPLQLPLQDSMTFENLVNQNHAVYALKPLNWGLPIVVSGPAFSGKTHLLRATCHHAGERGISNLYVNLQEWPDLSSNEIVYFQRFQIVALDNIDCLAGQANAEEALLHCYNVLQQNQKCLLLSAATPPAQHRWQLADLSSRLIASAQLALEYLDDAQKLQVIEYWAQKRAMRFDKTVALFVLHQYSRDLADLIPFLEKLEYWSLSQGRKLTIPLIKSMTSGDFFNTTSK